MTNTQKQTIVGKMSNVNSLEEFAGVLEYVAKDVLGYKNWYSLNQIKSMAVGSKKRYREFTIPKKSGGVRTITAPCRDLKVVQGCLNKLFQVIYEPSKQAYGFITGKSVADNAAYHVGQRYIFNIDLKDFFPSIEKRRLIARLSSAPFSFPNEVSLLIAGLACVKMGQGKKSVLPQGSPVSPTFSNIIAERLDRKLNKLANRYGARYSRYADDITFSSMNNIYRQEGDFYNAVCEVVTEEGFIINDNKVRLNRIGERLEITGLTVSDKVNVTRKYVNDLRWMIYHWERDGYNKAYAVFIKKYIEAKTSPVKGTPDMQNVIAGKLDYLKMVKGNEDSTYMKLKKRFDALIARQSNDGSISSILDTWENEGIEAAMKKYYSTGNASIQESHAIISYSKYPRLEKYTIDSFNNKYNVVLSFEEIEGNARAFINDSPSFLGHPIYVSKGFRASDADILVELLQGDKSRLFWYISNRKYENTTFIDDAPLHRIHFSVKSDIKEVKIRPAATSTNKPIELSLLGKDLPSSLKSLFEPDETRYEMKEYSLTHHLAHMGSSLLSVDFIYSETLSFCAVECVVLNSQTKDTKTVVITPRKMISESEIMKLKEYHNEGADINDIWVRIGKYETSSEFGCPKWTHVVFLKNGAKVHFRPRGKNYTHIFNDERVSAPTAMRMEDLY